MVAEVAAAEADAEEANDAMTKEKETPKELAPEALTGCLSGILIIAGCAFSGLSLVCILYVVLAPENEDWGLVLTCAIAFPIMAVLSFVKVYELTGGFGFLRGGGSHSGGESWTDHSSFSSGGGSCGGGGGCGGCGGGGCGGGG